MSVREYVGARYVPIFCGEWDTTMQTTYEPLSIVSVPNVGSYTSKKFVPVGISITDTDYWALSGSISGVYTALENRVSNLEGDVNTINTVDIPAIQGDITNIDNVEIPAIQSDISALVAKFGDIGIDPDDYTDATDAGKIQHAIDDAAVITSSANDPDCRNVVILIKREYDLSGSTIYLKNGAIWPHSHGSGGFITFLGVGKGGFYKDDIGYARDDDNYMFAKDPGITGNAYRHRFINLRFTGPDTQFTTVGYPDPTASDPLNVNKHAAAINMDNLAWTYFENCYFSNLSYAYDCKDVNDTSKVCVGLYCSNNHYIYLSGVFRGGAHFNAIYFNHEEIGLCWTAFALGNGISTVFVVRDSIIEYMLFYDFQFINGFKGSVVTIEGNYIEGCALGALAMGATAYPAVLNFNNNLVEINGAGTDASSFGLQINCNSNCRTNINGNHFNARSDSTSYGIGTASTPSGSPNVCTGNYFEGGSGSYSNVVSALASYITLQ